MLWTGRVRAINSSSVGGEGGRGRDETRVGAVRWGARGQSDYVSQTPRSLVRPSHRHHHPPPFRSLRTPRSPPRPCSRRAFPRLTSSHRTLYGVRTTLFVCFQPVCARTRRYAISVSGMRATGRTTRVYVSRVRVLCWVLTRKKKDRYPFGRLTGT